MEKDKGYSRRKLFVGLFCIPVFLLVVFVLCHIRTGVKTTNDPVVIMRDHDVWSVQYSKSNFSIYSKAKKKQYKFSAGNGFIISGCISCLSNPSQYYLLLLVAAKEGSYADDFVAVLIDEKDTGIRFKTVCRKSLKAMKPWKIQTCDIDGDGQKEISIGMYKTTRFHPVLAKRPFLYQWTGKVLAPKWLGSRLSKPFEDYLFYDLDKDGKDELVALEVLQGGKHVISAYTWKGFGFELAAESRSFKHIQQIRKSQEGILMNVEKDQGDGMNPYSIEYSEGKLIAKKVE